MPLFHTVQGLVSLLEGPTKPVYVGAPNGRIEVFDRVVGHRDAVAEPAKEADPEKSVVERAREYVEDALKSRPPFLVTGVPSSRTQYTTDQLKKALDALQTPIEEQTVF